MKRKNQLWTAVATVLIGANLIWYAASAGAGDGVDQPARLPITCEPNEDHVGGTGYAGLALPGEPTDDAINNLLAESDGTSLTAEDYEEVVDAVPVAVDGEPVSGALARVFVDRSERSALYLEEVDGQWRVEASVACESFVKEEV